MSVQSQISSITGANGINASLAIGTQNTTSTPGTAGSNLNQPLGSWYWAGPNTIGVSLSNSPTNQQSSTLSELSIYVKNIPLGSFGTYNSLVNVDPARAIVNIVGYWRLGPDRKGGDTVVIVSQTYQTLFYTAAGNQTKTGSVVRVGQAQNHTPIQAGNSGNVSYSANAISGSNTIGESLLAAQVQTQYTSGNGSPNRVNLLLDLTFNYNYNISLTANLIIIDGVGTDSIQPIAIDTAFSATATKILPGDSSGDIVVDMVPTFTALNYVGFPFRSLHTGTDYFESDYIATGYAIGQINHIFEYIAEDYVDADYFATETRVLDNDLGQQYSIDSDWYGLGGIIQESGNVSIDISPSVTAYTGNVTTDLTNTPSSEFDFTATSNIAIQATSTQSIDAATVMSAEVSMIGASTNSIDTTLSAAPTVVVNGICSISQNVEFSNQYFQGEYVAAGYVDSSQASVIIGDTLAFTSDITANLSGNVDMNAASTLTIDTATQIETTVEMIVEASISADAAIQGTGGYLRTSGNVIFDGDTAVSISQYITGGTGVILGSTQASLAMTGLSVTAGSNLTMLAQAVFDASLSIFIQAGRLDFYSAQLESGGSPYVEDLYTVPDYFVPGTGGAILSCLGEISTNTGAHLLSAFDWQILAGFGLFGNTTVDLFAMTVSLGATGRIARSDEFYTYRVPMELRQLYIQARLNVLIVADEQRINMITAEPRELAIGSETRTLKVNMAPATLESPRIRRLA